jgi:alpha-tubulin suppressor-like RCC1 family protein
MNGQAYVWGNNKQGECGCGSTMGGVDTPSAVEQGGVLFSFIDQGGDIGNNGHTLALTATGAVYAWGTGTNGQLGQGNTTNSSVPVLVPGLPVITDVRAGGVHSTALDAGGNVWAWGGNADGQVGNGTLTDVLTPVDVESGIGMISAGDVHSLSA